MTSNGDGRRRRGGGVRAETWWASRGGSTYGRNAREWGRAGRGVRRIRREGAGEGEGFKEDKEGGGRAGRGVRREGAGEGEG